MYEAKEQLLNNDHGIDISAPKISTNGYHIGYDVKQNRCVLLKSLTGTDLVEAPDGYVMGNPYDIFVPVDGFKQECIFSQYLNKNATDVTVTTDKGLDAGDCATLTTVNYTNTEVSKDVVIRTNSARINLTINAPLDDIDHYGYAGVVNIQKVATSSYNEFGSVAFVELSNGRIVLTESSDVEVINVSKKDENTYNNPIIADGGVLEENMPEIISRDQISVIDERGKTELVQIQELDANGNVILSNSEQIYAYLNGSVGTTEKVTTGSNIQNEDIDSTLGLIVLDSGSHAGEKAYGETSKGEAKVELVNNKIDEQLLKENNYVVRVNETGYMSLKDAFEHTSDNCVVRLLKNTNMFYTIQINNSLTFDLNGKTININSQPANGVEEAAVGDWNPISDILFDVANGVNLVVNGNGTINTSSNSDDWQKTLVLFNYAVSETSCSIVIENGTYNVYGAVVKCKKNCTVTINGGVFNETKETTGTNLFRIHGATLTFNAGEVNIISETAAFLVGDGNVSTLTINDIELNFTGSNNVVIAEGAYNYMALGYIKGGTFNIGSGNYMDKDIDCFGEFIVSGGSFDVDISLVEYGLSYYDGEYDDRYDVADYFADGKTLNYNSTTEMYEVG